MTNLARIQDLLSEVSECKLQLDVVYEMFVELPEEERKKALDLMRYFIDSLIRYLNEIRDLIDEKKVAIIK